MGGGRINFGVRLICFLLVGGGRGGVGGTILAWGKLFSLRWWWLECQKRASGHNFQCCLKRAGGDFGMFSGGQNGNELRGLQHRGE